MLSIHKEQLVNSYKELQESYFKCNNVAPWRFRRPLELLQFHKKEEQFHLLVTKFLSEESDGRKWSILADILIELHKQIHD